jgi:hypothetical protein
MRTRRSSGTRCTPTARCWTPGIRPIGWWWQVTLPAASGAYLAKALRDGGLPLPALVIGLCPWTEVGGEAADLRVNDRHDWVQADMTVQFCHWFTGAPAGASPAVSPRHSSSGASGRCNFWPAARRCCRE